MNLLESMNWVLLIRHCYPLGERKNKTTTLQDVLNPHELI